MLAEQAPAELVDRVHAARRRGRCSEQPRGSADQDSGAHGETVPQNPLRPRKDILNAAINAGTERGKSSLNGRRRARDQRVCSGRSALAGRSQTRRPRLPPRDVRNGWSTHCGF
jgi:hypothetical protein